MTNDEKKTLLQQRYAELDDESLCALERHKLTEQARELFDAELARRGLDLAAYEARHGDSLYRSRTALRQRQWRGVGLKAILAGVIFAGAALVRQQYGDSLDAMEALPVAAGGLALVILVLASHGMLDDVPLAEQRARTAAFVRQFHADVSGTMDAITATGKLTPEQTDTILNAWKAYEGGENHGVQ